MPLSPIEAIVSYTFQNPGAGPRGGMGTFRCTERDAQYLIEHLERCGHVIVPKEPTNRMIEAAIERHERSPRDFGYTAHYEAMIEARPK